MPLSHAGLVHGSNALRQARTIALLGFLVCGCAGHPHASSTVAADSPVRTLAAASPVPTASALVPDPATPSVSRATSASATITVPPNAALTAPAPAQGSRSSPPVSLTIPSLGIDTKLDRLGVDKNGVLTPPTRWDTAGWFAAGTIPGDVGPALVAGHIDSTSGPAVFARLRTVKPGAQVYVTRADGSRLTFVVDSGRSYPKSNFPTAVVYGPTPLRALRLVTCTGQFDRASGHYVDNYVVYAHLVA